MEEIKSRFSMEHPKNRAAVQKRVQIAIDDDDLHLYSGAVK